MSTNTETAEAVAQRDRAQFDRMVAASAANVAALAEEDGVWTASGSSVYPQTTCAINGSITAFVESVEGSDGVFVRSLVVQTNADINNPYVVVGVTIDVYTDVFDNNGIVLATFTHAAFAGAVLDPQGNNKSYTWIDNQVMPQPRLDRIAGVRIRFANAS
ncbi:MAG TPA: hypothetical protein VE196_08735 [Pseudonocardiaceae bacterium]|nr:hypothetical protein [Pseudonocardiaceae bacterium]